MTDTPPKTPNVQPLFPSQQREVPAHPRAGGDPPHLAAAHAATEARARAAEAVAHFEATLAAAVAEAAALAAIDTVPNGVRASCALLAGNLAVDQRAIAAIRERMFPPPAHPGERRDPS